jgi:hypothetical protein
MAQPVIPHRPPYVGISVMMNHPARTEGEWAGRSVLLYLLIEAPTLLERREADIPPSSAGSTWRPDPLIEMEEVS